MSEVKNFAELKEKETAAKKAAASTEDAGSLSAPVTPRRAKKAKRQTIVEEPKSEELAPRAYRELVMARAT